MYLQWNLCIDVTLHLNTATYSGHNNPWISIKFVVESHKFIVIGDHYSEVSLYLLLSHKEKWERGGVEEEEIE